MKKSFAKLARRSGSAVLAVATIVGMAAPATNLIAATTDNTVAAAKAQKVKSIKKSGSSYTVTVGKKQKVKATVTFKKKVNKAQAKKSVKVTSSASAKVKVASVAYTASAKKSKKWTVTATLKAIKAGSATVTMKSVKGSKSAEWSVTAKAATVAVKSVSIDNNAPVVGTQINATVSPSNATIKSYQWYRVTSAATIAISGATSAAYTPSSNDAGYALYVVATDTAGNSVQSTETSTVTSAAEEEAQVTLTDESGLQADGTALLADIVTLSYTAGLGTPQSMNLYLNGNIVKTYTTTNMIYTGKLSTTWGIQKSGEFYVEITNTNGKTYKSNTLNVTDEEVAVELSGFALADDYATPNVEISATTDRTIATITMTKQVAGDFYLYASTDEKYTTPLSIYKGTKATSTAAATAVTKESEFTDANAIKAANFGTNKNGIYYVYEDGSVSYKFVVDDDAANDANGSQLTRGTSYILAFDQANVTGDETDASTLALNLSDAATEPYVTAPASVTLTTPAVGDTSYVVTLKDASGNAYKGYDTTTFNGTLDVYTTGPTTTGTAVNLDVNEAVAYDAAKGTLATTSSAAAVASDYYYAELTGTAGIYSKDALKVTSDSVLCATPISGAITLAVNSSVNTMADITLATAALDAGTIYIWNNDNNNKLDPATASTYTGSVAIVKGQSSANIVGAITHAYYMKGNVSTQSNWYATFVPTDETKYAKVTSDAKQITQTETTYSMDESTGVTEGALKNKILAYDQYGTEIAAGPTLASTKMTHANEAYAPISGNQSIAGTSAVYASITSGILTLVEGNNGATYGEAQFVELASGKAWIIIQNTKATGSGETDQWTVSLTTTKPTAGAETEGETEKATSISTTSVTATPSGVEVKILDQFGNVYTGATASYAIGNDTTTTTSTTAESNTTPGVTFASGVLTIQATSTVNNGTYKITVYASANGADISDDEKKAAADPIGVITVTVHMN